MPGQPDIKIRKGWNEAALRLCIDVFSLSGYAKKDAIGQSLRAFVEDTHFFDNDVTLYTNPDGTVIVCVILRHYSSGERLQNAVEGLKAMIVTSVDLRRIGKGDRCEVVIRLAPRPSPETE